ncbi:MAG: geranylgeranylglycerol-phosphate geranylgeranyltransferase [Ginsengibacter sp.]
MKTLTAFFKLIRFPNLIFILLTQVLFRFFIIPFAYHQNHFVQGEIKLSTTLFFILTIASVFIAAAGYIINDYFDVNIDLINKSSKVIIGKMIKRRAAIMLHAVLSVTGLLLTLYVSYHLNNYYLLFFNFLAVLMLLTYSTTFKKKLLVGNILISILTAWVILVLLVAESRFSLSVYNAGWQRLLKLTFIYSSFAFISTLIREAIKDMEDAPGDRKYNCTTMPIVWGVPATKVYAAVWLVVLSGLVLLIQVYVLQMGWWLSAIYSIAFIVLPLIWVIRKLYESVAPADFHRLSRAMKYIMLAGILSMIFF